MMRRAGLVEWRKAAAGGLLAALFLTPRPAAAQGDAYISAYNTLASNLNKRISIAGGTAIAYKDPALGQTVAGWTGSGP